MFEEEKEAYFTYNKNVKMLYKDTETRFANDPDVLEDDLTVMCKILYQKELLDVFGLTDGFDFRELTNRMEIVYDLIKTDVRIIELITKNYFQDDLMTFFTLFAYDTLETTHAVICLCLPC